MAAVAGLAVVAACSGSGASVNVTTSAPTTTAAPRHAADGQFVLGVLLPSDGPGAAVGQGLRTGIDVAVAEIDAAGGVLGRLVVVRARDEGADTAATALAVSDLLGQGVDAIVGPVSARAAALVVERASAAGVITCNPVTAAPGPATRAGRDLVVRTLPSATLSGAALGQVLAETGSRKVAVVAPADEYGRAMADGALAAVRGLGIEAGRVAYDARTPLPADVTARTQAERPAAVAVIGTPDPGAGVLGALLAAGIRPPNVPVVLSDGFRQADLALTVAPGRPDALSGVTAVAPASEPAGWFRDLLGTAAPGRATSYSGYGYDCVTLLALAVASAGSDDPSAFGPRVVEVSRGGVSCRGFGACAALLAEGRNIDDVGATGPLDLDESGNRVDGDFELTRFDATGRESLVRLVSVR